MLQCTKIEVNPFGEITYILWDTETLDAGIIDPGMSSAEEQQAVDSIIIDNKLNLKWILNTHLHLDHAFGVNYIKQKYNVPLNAGAGDEPLAERIQQQAVMFHLPFTVQNVQIDHRLHEGDTLYLGNIKFEVIDMPGHTPGGIALYCPQAKVAFTGDSIFRESIGRTDLPGGNHHALLDSVNTLLTRLPKDTTLLPGHGPATDVAHETGHNPFI